MLSSRFSLNSSRKPLLTHAQQQAVDAVNRKVLQGDYRLESPPCPVCDAVAFEPLAELDRYGLTMSVVLCSTCGLVQTHPRMDETAYAHFYDTYYSTIYHPFRNTVDDYFREQYKRGNRIATWIEGCLGRSVSGMNVLEVGCGAGGVLKAFRDRGAFVRGCDLIHSYVENAAGKHGLDVVYGTLESLPPQPAPELVIYSHVVEHLSDPLGELARLQLLCRDRHALVYVEVPGLHSIRGNYRWDLLQYLQNAHVWHFTLDTLTALMAKGGFRRVHGTEWVFGLFQPTEGEVPRPGTDPTSIRAWLQATEQGKRWSLLHPATLRRETVRFLLRLLDSVGIRARIFDWRNRS